MGEGVGFTSESHAPRVPNSAVTVGRLVLLRIVPRVPCEEESDGSRYEILLLIRSPVWREAPALAPTTR